MMLTPAPQRIDALHRVRRHGRQKRVAILVDGPGAGKIIGGDQDRRDAVTDAHRAVLGVAGVERGLDPERAAGEAAGKLGQDEEGLGQHMVRRHRFQRRHVEIAENVAQPLGRRTGRIGADAVGELVAGVEQDRAALLHIGIDARDRRLARHRGCRVDRPIDQRVEGQFVLRDVDAGRRSGFERGLFDQEAGQAFETGAAD